MSYSTELLDKINAISSFINTHRCDHQVWLNIETLKYQWKFIFLPESIWWEIISLNIPLPTGNIFLGKNISTHSFLKEKLSDKCTKIKSSGTNSFQSIRVYVSSNIFRNRYMYTYKRQDSTCNSPYLNLLQGKGKHN